MRRAGSALVEGVLILLSWLGDLLQVAFFLVLLGAWQLGAAPAWQQVQMVAGISPWWWGGLGCGLLLITAVHRLLFPIARRRPPAPRLAPAADLPESSPPRREPRLE